MCLGYAEIRNLAEYRIRQDTSRFESFKFGIYADQAKANRYCDLKEKMKNTIAAFAVMFLLLIVFLYKPFPHAFAMSANPNVVSGMRHTAGLKSDGMVVATGLNQHGQCNVSSWRDIAQIAAGGCFTVGLKSDRC